MKLVLYQIYDAIIFTNDILIVINIYSGKFASTTLKLQKKGFPGGAVVENLPANAGDAGSSPGLGRSHMPRSN